jgi:hypothetical protein
MIGVAQEPSVGIDNPTHSLSEGQSVTVNDRVYTVSSIDGETAQLTWVDEEAEHSELWENGSDVTIGETEFTVRIDPGEDPTSATLVEVQTVGENVTTVEMDGSSYVVIETDGQQVLIPEREYVREQQGEPERRAVAEGDSFEYQDQTVTVQSIASGGLTIEWQAPEENTVRVSEGDVVDLNGQEFVGHFPDATTLDLSTDISSYTQQVEVLETYHERINGLWGVSILSGMGAVLTLAVAFLPSRY